MNRAKANKARDAAQPAHRPRTVSLASEPARARLAMLAYGALMLYQLVMSLWAVVGSKLLNEAEGPPLSVFLLGRHFLASLALAALAVLQHGVNALLPQHNDLQRLVLAGVLAQYASPMFYLFGLQFVPATIGSIFDGPLIPLIVYVMALSVGVESLPPTAAGRALVVMALGLSSGGAAMLIVLSAGGPDESDGGEGAAATGGNPMFFSAVLSLALEASALSASLIIQKPLASKYRLMPFAFWMSVSGLLAVTVQVGLYEEGGLSVNIWRLMDACQASHNYTLAMLYNALAVSVINILCMSFANGTLPSSMVALGACVQPVFSLMLDVALYGAPFYALYLLAFSFVSVGIYLFTKYASPQPTKLAKSKKFASEIALDEMAMGPEEKP